MLYTLEEEPSFGYFFAEGKSLESNGHMNITVAICTWNRADLLNKTLENMLQLKADSSFSWNLIVVNNKCTDNTDQVIEMFLGRLPIKRVSEPTPGLSHARNAAVRNAVGDYIVWTDDDVLVDQDWLLAYVKAFRKYPDAAVFGGPVEPWFEGNPPDWLSKNWLSLSGAFAVRDLGLHEKALCLDDNVLPFGANYAVKTSIQKNYLYDPNLGLCAGKIILDEETKVFSSIFHDGFKGWWVPEAKVRHWIPKTRQTLKYIHKYFVGWGRSILRKENKSICRTICGYPHWMLRKYLFLLVKYRILRLTSSSNIWIKYLKELSIYKGKFLEYKELYGDEVLNIGK